MSFVHLKSQANSVDITLLLESSYPYIHGGVSSWVHQLIENFPQYTFALIFLGGKPEDYLDGIRYVLPNNVTHFQVHFLFDEDEPLPSKRLLTEYDNEFELVDSIHEAFRCPHASVEGIEDITKFMNDPKGLSYVKFLYSESSWEYIKKSYRQQCEDESFIDYFWTVKNVHKPLWKISSILEKLPKTKLVHTISTGYAGLLGYFIQKRFQYPVVLTEHGIYTKERIIDIFLSYIFREEPDQSLTDNSYFFELWIRYFRTLSRLTYEVSNPIISLFSNAHQVQLDEGAQEDKACIIPNGVDIERLRVLRKPLQEKEPIICFIGRVVPIKDVKGFIRAIPNVHAKLPQFKVWIVGSTDQDSDYAEECVELVENVMLQDVIQFIPHQKLEEVLPKVSLVVLSSIRESMPLVILESFAAGVPVVATNTGACAEMIEGVSEEDRAIGAGGRVVSVSSPKKLELAILEILENVELWNSMSKAGITRVEKYYDQKMMVESYQTIYGSIINQKLPPQQ